MNKLYVIGGPMSGTSFSLSNGITTMGRSPDNDICISDTGVSRHHAKLLKKDESVFIVDLNSLQGVFVDGQKIEPGKEIEIKKESTIVVGNTVFSFQQELPRKKVSQPHPTYEQRNLFDTSESVIVRDSSRTYPRSLELLLKVSNIFSQSLTDINELLGQVVDQIFRLLKRVDRGAILLINKETGTLREMVSKTRLEDKEGLFSKINYSRTIANRTINEGKPVMLSDTSTAHKADLSSSIEQMNIRSVMCVPLKYRGEVRGIIYVDSIGVPGGFTKHDLQLLTGLSNTASIAIENARLYDAVKQELAERKRAEEALRESEEFSSSLLTNSPIPTLVINPDSSVKYVNPALEKLTGFTSEELIGAKIPYPWWTSETLEKTRIGFEKAFHTGAQRAEELFQKKNGKKFWVEITGQPVKKDAELKYYLASWVDITESKRAGQEIRKLSSAVEQSIDGIAIADLEGALIYVNEAFARMHGYSPEKMTGMKDTVLCNQEKMDDCKMRGDHIKTNGSWTGEIEHIRKDGTSFPTLTSATLLKDDNGNPTGVLAVVQDITEQKELEAQLQYAQKMEALGTLAGGIAHNFNNILMGIQGNNSLMRLKTGPDDPNYKRLVTVDQLVQNGSKLTKQLLGYAREGGYEIRTLNVNQSVKEISDTFGATKKEIRVHQDLAENLFEIKGDQGQIEQALLNLYVNAADVMPRGGDLFLKTRNVTHKDMNGKPYKPKPGNYVLISVRDTGTGMDKKTAERIFDPFFTTKGLGKGTGLGLASVYGTIKGHGGYIDVESKKGEGTTFTIYLPQSEREVMKQKDLAAGVIKGQEGVLLVDDEDIIIDVGQEILDTLGYKVLVARGGKEAIEIYGKDKDKINLVILDIIMPDVGGGEVYDRMKEINPEVKVLLSSGYNINGQAAEILERGCNGFIQKPFNIKQLSTRIKEILETK